MKARRISGKTSYSPRLNKKAASFHTTSPPRPPPHLLSQSVSRNPFNTTRPEKALFPSLSLSDLIAGGHPSLACPCRQCPLAPLHPRSRGVGLGSGLGLIGKQKKTNAFCRGSRPVAEIHPVASETEDFPSFSNIDFRGLSTIMSGCGLRLRFRAPTTSPSLMMN